MQYLYQKYIKKIETLFSDDKYNGTFKSRWNAITKLFNEVNSKLSDDNKLFFDNLDMNKCLEQYSNLIIKLKNKALPNQNTPAKQEIDEVLEDYYKLKLHKASMTQELSDKINDFKSKNYDLFYKRSLVVLLNQIQYDEMFQDSIDNLYNFLKETIKEYNISNRDIFKLLDKLQNKEPSSGKIVNAIKERLRTTMPSLTNRKEISTISQSYIDKNMRPTYLPSICVP